MTAPPHTPSHMGFTYALETLGLSGEESQKELRRAYRRLLASHPPDRDPDGFLRIRQAYEVLLAPEAALELLIKNESVMPLPEVKLPEAVNVDAELARHVLRTLVQQLDAEALLGGSNGK